MEQNSSNFRITSKHFIQQIETSLIKLTQCLAIEHQIKPDPDAKNMARRIVQERVNQLLNDEEIEGIRLLKKDMKEAYKLYTQPVLDMVGAMYEVLKLTGLDDV